MEEKKDAAGPSQELKDANACIAIGAGVGALGAAGAMVAGAVCPLCIFVAPGLIGVGAYKRWKAKRGKDAVPEDKA